MAADDNLYSDIFLSHPNIQQAIIIPSSSFPLDNYLIPLGRFRIARHDCALLTTRLSLNPPHLPKWLSVKMLNNPSAESASARVTSGIHIISFVVEGYERCALPYAYDCVHTHHSGTLHSHDATVRSITWVSHAPPTEHTSLVRFIWQAN